MSRQLPLIAKRDCRTLVKELMAPDDGSNSFDVALGELLERVMLWCRDQAPDFFDDSFIHSLYMQFHDRGTLSEKQVFALIRIVTKFEID